MDIHSRLADTDTPRGSILFSHGLGEHSGRYLSTYETFAAAGYDVYFYDHAGHGTAPGPRALVDVGRLITDHVALRRQLTTQLLRTPTLFLYGNSMGGTVCAASALLDNTALSGLILSGPAFLPCRAPSRRTMRILSPISHLFGRIPTLALDEKLLTHDEAVLEERRNDPLIFRRRIPLLTSLTLIMQGQKVLENAELLTTPTLVLHGEEDGLASPKGSEIFVKSANRTQDIHLRIISGAYHELLHEPQADTLENDILVWMGEH